MSKKQPIVNQFTPKFVSGIAVLANIPVTNEEAATYGNAFTETMEVVDQLKTVDVSDTEPTNQVTGLENVWREDELWPNHMFTQEQALANAAQTHQGYIVVNRVIDQEE
ncbi:Asp-tRNA(Asn)/Glu-tRNA(Gln) amidotransferase subunit GatC [Candidatus Woesebacteria bacterium]|nr:Asp-tRNA(Asn)/Glu-tRNA(Gln) amidotransferase subunit GatC [Candidatus Woesebacteria bacterium]